MMNAKEWAVQEKKQNLPPPKPRKPYPPLTQHLIGVAEAQDKSKPRRAGMPKSCLPCPLTGICESRAERGDKAWNTTWCQEAWRRLRAYFGRPA